MTLLYTLKFLHFVGLALGVGTSFAVLALGAASRDLAPEERTKFLLRAAVLRKNGSYGLALLLLTGIAMFVLRGPAETMRWGGGFLHLKLTLVVLLCGWSSCAASSATPRSWPRRCASQAAAR
ncbi:MAG: hypothetical protein K0R38_7163 [Polyangiaceae bacterium]|nr:hypothetical protein [Polyangiaceae bacterium]